MQIEGGEVKRRGRIGMAWGWGGKKENKLKKKIRENSEEKRRGKKLLTETCLQSFFPQSPSD